MKKIKMLNLNAVELIDKYKDDSQAYLYLDPPYMSRGVSNIYKELNLLVFSKILEAITSPNYKCKIMLHIDLNGWVVVNMYKYIRYTYPTNYNMRSFGNKKNVVVDYQCIITNYELQPETSAEPLTAAN